MPLGEKQWELSGLTFGLGSGGVEVTEEGFTPGEGELTTGDQSIPGGDGIRFGEDYRGGGTWSFSMFTNGETEEEGWAIYAALRSVWDARTTRTVSESALPLRYCLAGKTRRVYGRPRRITPVVNNLSMQGRIGIEADFTLAYPLFFDDTLKSATMGIGVPLDLNAGVPVPFVPPFVPNAGTSTRQTAITIGGTEPTPVTVKITGPVNNAIVRIGETASIILRDSVTAGNPVTADPRPWVRSITTASGGSVKVSPRETRLSSLWLPPGTHEVTFTGEDITSNSSVMVSWHDAYGSPR